MKTAIVKHGLVGMIVALLLVLVTYLVADAASGPLIVTQPGSDTPAAVPLGAALVFTMLGTAAGIGLASIVNRFGRPRSTFVAAALVALALYGIMPFAAAEQISTAVWLNVMHLAAAVPIVGLLARAFPDRSGSQTAAGSVRATS